MPVPSLRTSLLTLTALTWLGVGCGDPCLDDGPSIGECKNMAASGTGSETGSSAGSETGDSAATTGETGDSMATTTMGDGDGDPTTTGDGDGDPTTTGDGDGDDPCQNGMQDPGETDVDCGGDCVDINPDNPNDIEGQCGEGDDCEQTIDCYSGECGDNMTCDLCPGDPPEFDPMALGYNDCQSCLLTNCCQAVVDCFENIEKCVCWFNCVEHTGSTQLCMDECGNGNIGMINSCMNNSCGADGVSLNCDAP